MKIAWYLLLAAVLICGCETTRPGRFCLVDIDFRSADQITAGQTEALVPYVPVTTNSVKPPKVPDTQKSMWTKAVDFVMGAFGTRIRLINVEWGN